MGAYDYQFANPIRLVKIVQETEGTPGSFPTEPNAQVYKCMPVKITDVNKVEGGNFTIKTSTDPDRAIYAVNFRANCPVLGQIYLVFQIEPGIYVFDNQMAFLENQ